MRELHQERVAPGKKVGLFLKSERLLGREPPSQGSCWSTKISPTVKSRSRQAPSKGCPGLMPAFLKTEHLSQQVFRIGNSECCLNCLHYCNKLLNKMLGVPAHTLLAICSITQNNGIPFKWIWQGIQFFSLALP